MVEEGEEVQSQETELEMEEEGVLGQADIPSLTDAGSGQETFSSPPETTSSQSETTPSQPDTTLDQTGAGSSPDITCSVSEAPAAGVGPEAIPGEDNSRQDSPPAPGETI